MGTKTGPASTVVEPRPAGAPAAGTPGPDQDFVIRRIQDEAKIREFNQKRADKIGIYLQAQYCRHDMTWPFLQTAPGYQLRVSRFYPTIKVALDIFPQGELTQMDVKEIEFKRKVFKANGIRYGALTYKDRLEDLTAQIGLP